MTGKTFVKDPSDVLDYLFDFAPAENAVAGATTNWLDRTTSPLEGIATRTISVSPSESPETLTVDSSSIVNSSTGVRVWLSAGTVGKVYRVTCRIVSDATTPRTKSQTIEIVIGET